MGKRVVEAISIQGTSVINGRTDDLNYNSIQAAALAYNAAQ